MSPEDYKPHNLSNCFPRVSGDEPGVWIATNPAITFSPRERG